MKNYNFVANTVTEKYKFIETVRNAGAIVTGVSGYYGNSYYIQVDATPEQAEKINNYLQGVTA